MSKAFNDQFVMVIGNLWGGMLLGDPATLPSPKRATPWGSQILEPHIYAHSLT